MNRWIRFAGILGLVLFLFGTAGSFLVGSFTEPLLLAHLLGGFALLVIWFLLSGVQNLSSAGGVIKGRTTRFGASAVAATAFFLGILVAVNWFANRYNKRWDLTEQNVYSLADQSSRTVDALKKPLKLVGFKAGEGSEQIEDLLALYKERNPGKVTTQIVDPRTKPQLVDTYGMKPGNLIYLQYGEGENPQVSRLNEVTEEALTNAIIKLTRGEARKVYYVTGHGEPDLQGRTADGLQLFAGAIGDEHMTMEPILLSKGGSIPGDAAAVLLVSPKKQLLPDERDMLAKYAEEGGRLVLFADPRGGDDVKQIASRFGIQVGDDVVIDQIQRLFAGPALGAQPVVQSYGSHPITKDFGQDDVTIFNIASSVKPAANPAAGVTYTELAKTGPTAWGETNVAAVFDAEAPSAVQEAGDTAGPVTLAVAYEKKLDAPKAAEGEKEEKQDPSFEKVSRVVVFGDSDFLFNANLGVYSNRDLALNTVNWVVGEEGGISIRPRSVKASVAPIERGTYFTILASSFVIPELILILGLFVWWKRREVSVA